MPALVIGGVTVRVIRPPTGDGASWRIAAEGGALERAASGRLGGAVRWQKREWVFSTAPMTAAEVATLRAAAPVGLIVVCSGDALGGAVSGVVQITERAARRVRGGGHTHRLSIRLIEA